MLLTENEKSPALTRIVKILILLADVLVSWYCSETVLYSGYTFSFEGWVIALNLGTLLCHILFFYLVIGNLGITLIVWNLFIGCVAAFNYFALPYHLMPISWLDVRNIRTAASYAGKFSYELSPKLIFVLSLLIFGIFVGIGMVIRECRHKGLTFLKLRTRALILCCVAGAMWCGYLSPFAMKPRNTLEWTWAYSYPKYGFWASSVESLWDYFFVPVIQPEGYDESAAEAFAGTAEEETDQTAADTQYPDIILILNESFFDLRRLMELPTDQPFLKYYDSFDGIKGYSCSPRISGCTNYCEFELLTGNTTRLLLQTPFETLNMKNMESSVSALKALGYSTMACHPEKGENYARNKAYPAMGFDAWYFVDSFLDREALRGDGYLVSDRCVYRNLIQWYEEMGDGPRFCYALTMQNHGGYELSDDSEDTIHVLGDHGEYNSILNEYLTSIAKADEAFYELTQYFKNAERPVILCMVGDHAPYFVEAMNGQVKEDELDRILRLRATPYMIWSNVKEADGSYPFIGHDQLFSVICKEYGINAGAFFENVGDMSETYPVVVNSMYMDQNGTLHDYKTDGIPETIRKYFDASYLRMKPGWSAPY